MLVLNILCMSSVRGTVSKALLMSLVARCLLCAGLAIFGRSCMYCGTVVRNVVVECRALKPCCVCDRRMCGVIVLRISLSRILMGHARRWWSLPRRGDDSSTEHDAAGNTGGAVARGARRDGDHGGAGTTSALRHQLLQLFVVAPGRAEAGVRQAPLVVSFFIRLDIKVNCS